MNFMLAQGELLGKPDSYIVKKVTDIPAWDRKIDILFLQCRLRFIKIDVSVLSFELLKISRGLSYVEY
jgi:hypothetical protein